MYIVQQTSVRNKDTKATNHCLTHVSSNPVKWQLSISIFDKTSVLSVFYGIWKFYLLVWSVMFITDPKPDRSVALVQFKHLHDQASYDSSRCLPQVHPSRLSPCLWE